MGLSDSSGDIPAVLQVYVRHGCHLCEDMLRALEAFKGKYDFTVNIIDISGDDKLESVYGTRVPVLSAAGNEICYYFLDEQALDNYFSHP
ncbi:MAG: glutaredoxin family protein [Gammaproteobacteria bacterium]|nr:glutaredoxin family protein [Gammaproteobacteria bacterium]